MLSEAVGQANQKRQEEEKQNISIPSICHPSISRSITKQDAVFIPSPSFQRQHRSLFCLFIVHLPTTQHFSTDHLSEAAISKQTSKQQ
jgi:hypothetical protein